MALSQAAHGLGRCFDTFKGGGAVLGLSLEVGLRRAKRS
jgi:hypothetical protein